MATSKLPNQEAAVPANIIDLSMKLPSFIFCNLRLRQRSARTTTRRLPIFFSDKDEVYDSVHQFLRNLQPNTKVALLFQGYAKDKIGTAIVNIEKVFWTDDGYPRLDFKHPKELEEIHGCPNFWGAFILAIGAVKPETECFADADPDAWKFHELKDYFISIFDYPQTYEVIVVRMEHCNDENIDYTKVRQKSLGCFPIHGALPEKYSIITYSHVWGIKEFWSDYMVISVNHNWKKIYVTNFEFDKKIDEIVICRNLL